MIRIDAIGDDIEMPDARYPLHGPAVRRGHHPDPVQEPRVGPFIQALQDGFAQIAPGRGAQPANLRIMVPGPLIACVPILTA